ncbi:MAG TPA: ferredoxin reductase [Gammaproteobacteria bacterium]|nr:ferredoxin reductase [Gammaproteobacteria bacterium]
MEIPGANNATAATDAPAAAGRLPWRTVRVESIEPLGQRAKLLHLSVADWPGHLPGQHVDLRLTASDGYQAQRSYSIASAAHEPGLSIAVERVDDGEVSPYLTTELRAGDVFELRGPIGGYFVWEAAAGGPLFLCAGGSGVAPFMAMLAHRERLARGLPTTLLYSTRSPGDAMFAMRIDALAEDDPALQIVWSYTRAAPPGWTGYARRVDAAILRETAPSPDAKPLIYVCGPTSFVEGVATALVDLGHGPGSIRTERFGPSAD